MLLFVFARVVSCYCDKIITENNLNKLKGSEVFKGRKTLDLVREYSPRHRFEDNEYIDSSYQKSNESVEWIFKTPGKRKFMSQRKNYTEISQLLPDVPAFRDFVMLVVTTILPRMNDHERLLSVNYHIHPQTTACNLCARPVDHIMKVDFHIGLPRWFISTAIVYKNILAYIFFFKTMLLDFIVYMYVSYFQYLRLYNFIF